MVFLVNEEEYMVFSSCLFGIGNIKVVFYILNIKIYLDENFTFNYNIIKRKFRRYDL